MATSAKAILARTPFGKEVEGVIEDKKRRRSEVVLPPGSHVLGPS